MRGLPADQSEDERLVAEILLRQEGADRRFFEKFGKLINTVVSRFLKGADRNDAVQEVYVRFCDRDWRVLRLWDKSGPLSAYLARIAANLCKDLLKKRQAVDTGDPPDIADEDPANDPEAATMAVELRRCLQRALEALSETSRTIIELRHLRNLTHQQIAETLGKTTGYVGPTLMRAERYLKDELRVHCGDHLGEFEAVVT